MFDATRAGQSCTRVLAGDDMERTDMPLIVSFADVPPRAL
jgi:hypothetical protein